MSFPFKRNQKKEEGEKKEGGGGKVSYDEDKMRLMEQQLAEERQERLKAEQRFAEQLAQEREAKLEEREAKLEEQRKAEKAEAEKAVLGQQLNKAEAEKAVEQQRANKAEEEKGVLDQQLNKRVKACIDGSPFSTHPFKPAWGDEILKGESKCSTKTNKSWLPIGKEHVRPWTEGQLVIHLEKADNWLVTDEGNENTKLLDVIFAGKADISLQRLLNGTDAGNDAGTINDRAKLKSDVEAKLWQYVWIPLQIIMGGKGKALADRLPVGNHICTQVRNCGKSASTGALVPFAEQYSKFYKNDKTIETVSEGVKTDFPPADVESTGADKTNSLLCSRIMVEIKPDVLCPLTKIEGDVLQNIAVGGDLYDYMQSKDYFDSDYNPVAQVVTYAAASRTNFVMIHTFNHMTLGFIDESQENEANPVPITLLSRKFDCTSCDPPFPSRPTWSLWEVLIRFILAAKGEWYRHKFPDSLKQLFASQIESKKQEKEDKERKRSADEKSGGRDSSSTSKKTEFGGNGGGGGVVESGSFTTLSYADLWDPLRFAIPATHSIEEESTHERLPGDAEVIGEGRMGTVYRKQLHGYDAAVKLLVFYDIRYIDGRDQHPIILRGEMENEFNVYNYLGKLQGMTIPKLLWYGELVPGMSDALVTEYVGEAFPINPNPLQIVNCLAALASLHQNNVLHGDVALRNFVCQKDQVFILDFGFSVIRTDEDDVTWESEVSKEKELLQKELCRSRKRLFEG